jgi:6-phosphogluconolactonase (cycloisomerase 2 family)
VLTGKIGHICPRNFDFFTSANVDHLLLFADQGKQTSVFRLQKTNGSLQFPFSFAATQTGM